jgi:hypothetical protein
MKDNQLTGAQMSRRAMIKTASITATSIALGVNPAVSASVPKCQVPSNGFDYDPTSTVNALQDSNIAPLFAAWLIFTTNSPDDPSEEFIQAIAGLGSKTAKNLMDVYKGCQGSFSEVRKAFGVVAYSLARVESPYSGGQCPESIDTISPVSNVDTSKPATKCGNPPTDSPIQYPSCISPQLRATVDKKIAAKRAKIRP